MNLTTTAPRCSAAISRALDSRQALDQALDEACGRLDAAGHLAFLFASAHHRPQFEHFGPRLVERLGSAAILGCTGESIVGNDREIEGEPALALWLAHLPGTDLLPMHLEFDRTPEGGAFVGWPNDLPPRWPAGAALLLLGDPFSFPADALLARIDDDHPGVPVLGGMASSAARPGENRLLLGAASYDRGAVAVLVSGATRIRSVVSQGCRPIGRPFVITKAEANVIHELGGAGPGPAARNLRRADPRRTATRAQRIARRPRVQRVSRAFRPRRFSDPQRGGRGSRQRRDRHRRSRAAGADRAIPHPRRRDGRRRLAGAALGRGGRDRRAAGGSAAVHLQRAGDAALSEPITMPNASATALAAFPSPAFSPKANSVRSGARIFCTASPPVWP